MVTMFAKRLRQAREERGWSQQQLADRVGIARVTITMYEAGEREPDFETLTKLAQALGVTTDYLLGRTDNPHPPAAVPVQEEPWPEGVQVLRRASTKLTPEKKRLLIRLIEATLAEEEEEEKHRERETGGQANHGKGQPGPKGRPGGPAGK